MLIVPMHRHPKGQGLVELIIAVAIIMASTISTLGLVIATRATSSVSKAQILAANLAREGVEVVRGIRDDNWLKIDSGVIERDEWTQGLFLSLDLSSFDYTGIPVLSPTNNIWQMIFDPDTIDDDRTIVHFSEDTGRYLQVSNPGNLPPGYVPTNYRRFITLFPLCWDAVAFPGDPWNDEAKVPANNQTCADIGANYEQVGVEVRSRVRWTERGRPHSIEVTDKLFNWKI